MKLLTLLFSILLVGQIASAQEQETKQDTADLAKQTQNPVSSVISVPFQFNFNSGGGYADKTFFNLNVQPVIPFQVSKNWNLIARTIIPLDSIPVSDSRFSGVGDIQEQRKLGCAGRRTMDDSGRHGNFSYNRICQTTNDTGGCLLSQRGTSNRWCSKPDPLSNHADLPWRTLIFAGLCSNVFQPSSGKLKGETYE